MAQAFGFNERINSKLNQFRSDKVFIDVILRSNNDEIPAHGLLLSKYSKWFKEQLSQLERKRNEPVIIDLPVNPNSAMQAVIEAFYSGRLNLTIKNATSILKIGVFYGIDPITQIVRHFIQKNLNPTTALVYAAELINLDLIVDAQKLSKCIAGELHEIVHSPGVPRQISKEQIFKAVSDGRVFASIIKEAIFSKDITDGKTVHPALTEEQKVEIIDEYVGDKDIKIEDEKEQLASAINWDSPNSYKYLVHYKCDWVPPRISRKLLYKILNARRENSKVFKEDSNHANSKLSRWFPFAWIQVTADAIPTKETPLVYVNKFISTFGGCTSPINPSDFGFINANDDHPYTGEVYSPHFHPKKMLEHSQDYFSALNSGSVPSATVNYGDIVKIKPKDIFIDCCIPFRPKKQPTPQSLSTQPTFQPLPQKLVLTTSLPNEKIKKSFTISLNQPVEKTAQTNQVGNTIREPADPRPTIYSFDTPFSKFTIGLPDKAEETILRIRKVDIYGQFIPN